MAAQHLVKEGKNKHRLILWQLHLCVGKGGSPVLQCFTASCMLGFGSAEPVLRYPNAAGLLL